MKKIKEKNLYKIVYYREIKGSSYKDPDKGDPWSGYNHVEIEITHMGPAYFSEEGKSWRAKRVENIDPKIDWEIFVGKIYLVLVRYTTGGTFGETNGEFDLHYVTGDLKSAEKWRKDNYKDLEKRYTGYFERLESVDVELVELIKDSEVEHYLEENDLGGW